METFVLNFRYLAAAGISLAIHTALIWSVPEKKAFAMPTGSTSSQVNIQFVTPSVPPPQSVQTKKNEVTKPKEQQKQQSTVEKTVQKQVQKKKSTKPKPKKKMVKKPKTSKPIETKKNVIKEKAETKPTTKTAKKTDKPVASKSGATEKPQLVQKPSFLKRPDAPRYPRIAQRKGIEGTALYEIWLNENGKQIKQELITSSGAQVLDEAALNAIRDWQFSPQVINGQAIAHRVQIPVRFSLN